MNERTFRFGRLGISYFKLVCANNEKVRGGIDGVNLQVGGTLTETNINGNWHHYWVAGHLCRFLVTINVPMSVRHIEFFKLENCGSEKIPRRTRSEIPTRMHISQSYGYRYSTVGWQYSFVSPTVIRVGFM